MHDNEIIKHIEELLKLGRTFEAHNSIVTNTPELSKNIRLNQLYALTLSRLGATEKALAVIKTLYDTGCHDGETSGIMGRIYKDLWKKTDDIQYAKKSRDIYLDSFKRDNDYYPGINAATMSLLIGDTELSKIIAADVLRSVESKNDYWRWVTSGEASLILGQYEESFEGYAKAIELCGNNFGSISSSYQQLLLISKYINIPEKIMALLKPPVVVIFSGHMLDKPGRNQPRFTENMTPFVREQIRKHIKELGCKISYSSAACGSDLIFIEEMKKINGEVNIVLPFDIEDFLHTSVNYAGTDWVEKFHKGMLNSYITQITEENFLGCNALFSFTNDILIGMAYLRSHLLQTRPVLLAVADTSDPSGHSGGVMDVIGSWKKKDNIRIIDIKDLNPPKTNGAKKNSQNNDSDLYNLQKNAPYGMEREIKCILFADMVGFSKIAEQYTPYFMFELMESVGAGLKELKTQPEIINTWGDAIFAVYEKAGDIMEFAALLQKTVFETDWKEINLPEKMSIRISLHTGPIFIAVDSITHRLNAYGAHINRTARMEPITIPGCIYASQQFASRLIYETDDQYNYEYVGFIKLPKNFGKQEMFNIKKLTDKNLQKKET